MNEATMTPELWVRAIKHPEEFEVAKGQRTYCVDTVRVCETCTDYRALISDNESSLRFVPSGFSEGGELCVFRPRKRNRPKPTPEPDVAALVEALREIERHPSQADAGDMPSFAEREMEEIARAALARWDAQP